MENKLSPKQILQRIGLCATDEIRLLLKKAVVTVLLPFCMKETGHGPLHNPPLGPSLYRF